MVATLFQSEPSKLYPFLNYLLNTRSRRLIREKNSFQLPVKMPILCDTKLHQIILREPASWPASKSANRKKCTLRHHRNETLLNSWFLFLETSFFFGKMTELNNSLSKVVFISVMSQDIRSLPNRLIKSIKKSSKGGGYPVAKWIYVDQNSVSSNATRSFFTKRL